MIGRDSDFDAGGVGSRPPVGDATGALVRPLGAFERMFHLSEQKSTKHFCMVAELADDLDPDALAAAKATVASIEADGGSAFAVHADLAEMTRPATDLVFDEK